MDEAVMGFVPAVGGIVPLVFRVMDSGKDENLLHPSPRVRQEFSTDSPLGVFSDANHW